MFTYCFSDPFKINLFCCFYWLFLSFLVWNLVFLRIPCQVHSHLLPAPAHLWFLGTLVWRIHSLRPPPPSCCSVWCWGLSWVWEGAVCDSGWSLLLLRPLSGGTGIERWSPGQTWGAGPEALASSWSPSWNVFQRMLHRLPWEHLHQSWRQMFGYFI